VLQALRSSATVPNNRIERWHNLLREWFSQPIAISRFGLPHGSCISLVEGESHATYIIAALPNVCSRHFPALALSHHAARAILERRRRFRSTLNNRPW
jgi:hypothetical protein